MLRVSQIRSADLRFALGLFLAAALPLFTLCQGLAAPLAIDVGTSGDERYLSGFLTAIVGERVTYRWSGPDAELRLHGWVGSGARIALRLDGGPGATTRRLLLVRPHDDRTLASVDVFGGWNTYVVEVPRAALRHPDVLGPTHLGLRADRYRSAADGSALGFKLDSVRVEPLSIDWLAALARGALLTWALGLAFGVGLWLTARLPGRLSRVACLVTLAVSALTVAFLSLCLLRFPLLTAWCLPPLPVSCGTLTLLLVSIGLRARLLALRKRLLPRPRAPVALAVLLAALCALGLLYARVSLCWALAPAAVAVVLLFILITPRVAAGDEGLGHEPSTVHPTPRAPALALTAALILATAFALRFYRVTELPFGMWRDEARHGLAALRVLEDPSYRPVFLPAADIPAAGAYAFVPAFRFFGIHTWTMRLVTALAGALTVVPLAFVARRLTGRWDSALIAAGLLAGSSWHLNVSRLSFMSVFHPLCELSALAFCSHALEPRRDLFGRTFWLALTGALLGLAAYTYHSGRLAPVIGLAFVACLAGAPLRSSRSLTALATVGAACALVLMPLGLYALRAPQLANARIERVSLLSHALHNGIAPLSALDASLGRHLLMFHVRGDTIGRHSLPGQPQLDPIAGLGLLAGLIVLARRPRDARTLFLFAAIGIAIVPSLLSVDGPRVTRAFDVLPYACIVAAIGWSALIAPACVRERGRAWLPGCLTLAAAACAFWSYFVAAPRDEAVWRSFYPVETKVGEYLRALAEDKDDATLASTYAPAALANQDVTQYLAHGLRFGVYDDAAFRPVPAGAFRVLLPAGTDAALPTRLAAVLGRHASSSTPGSLLPDGATPAFSVLRFD